MIPDEIMSRIRDLLSDHFHIDYTATTPEATLEFLGLDEIDMIDLVAIVEDAFNVEINATEIDGETTIETIVKLVDDKIEY